MILVGRLGSHPDHENGKEIIRRIHGGLEGIAEHGQRIGVESDDQLYAYDDDIGDEDAAKNPAHPGGSFPRVCSAGHGLQVGRRGSGCQRFCWSPPLDRPQYCPL
jgi:hypothetical protein